MGVDMDLFPTEKHLCSWAGMSTGNNESAGKKKSEIPVNYLEQQLSPGNLKLYLNNIHCN